MNQNVKAQFTPEIFSQKKSGEIIKNRLNGSFPKYIDTVVDDKFQQMSTTSTWRNTFKHKSVINRLTLSIKDTTKAMQKFDYLFYFTIDTFDSKNQRGSFDLMMRMSYDPESHKAYIDKVVYQFLHSHKIIVRLNSIVDSSIINPGVINPNDLITNFNLESEIIVERYYLGSYSTPINSLSHSFIGKDKLKISWLAPNSSAPNSYELEWAFIDTSGMKFDSLKFDFKNNSTRVRLTNNSYIINTVYDAGVIVYRVRRVRPDSVEFKYDKFSNWFPNNQPTIGYVKNYSSSHKLFITSHENMNKNWDYQVAFAEEGMKKEVVNYFDGSLKRRQGVTLLNTNNFALVDESIYDNHGRESIKIIPAPSDSNTIRYYKKFNQNNNGIAYSARDFDTSTTTEDKCNGNYTVKPLGTQSGAGRYYSTANPDKSNENAAIPDAQGYPIVQTQLMPDPTGRVASQGGVGKAHQLGSGHETKYTYGTANQEELDELFASEVGVANHYKKNSVVDPNGQVSVSYIDQHGRVVATGLSGGVPNMVDSLDNFKKAVFNMIDLKNNNTKMSNSLVTRYDFDVINSGNHKIYYKLEAPDYKFGCVGYKPCYTCVYDLSVSLFDDCGNTLMNFKRPIGKLTDTSCQPLVFNLKDSVSMILGASASGDSIYFNLNKGHYHLYKVLTVNTDSIQSRIDKFVDNDTNCLKKFDEFLEKELDLIDNSNCECDTCGLDSLPFCEIKRILMLDDVSPFGQYFTFNELTFEVEDNSSVLRTNNGNPLFHSINHSNFKDESGKIDTIWIDRSQNAFYLPNELTIQEFVEYWKPSWANALLPLHPEYCYYQFCLDNKLNESNVYDEFMLEVEEFDTAITYGLFNPLNSNSDFQYANKDPFFFASNGSLNSRGNELKTRLEFLNNYSVGNTNDPLLISVNSTNLWQFSKAIGFCENISDSFKRQSCFKFYYSDNVSNNWMNDEIGRNNYWSKFKTLYYQIKNKYIEELMISTVSGTYCVKNIGVNCENALYKDKISHFVKYQVSNPLENYMDSIKAEKNRLLDSLKSLDVCKINLNDWDNSLKHCPNYSTHRDSILFHLLKICELSSLNVQTPNIMGASNIDPALTKGKRFKSFEQVLKHFLGNNYKSVLCNIDLINSPREYNTDYDNAKPMEATDCICNKVKEEIKVFKDCIIDNDSFILTKEGTLMKLLINGMVGNNLFNMGSISPPALGSYSDLIEVANKLFVPKLGGNPNRIRIKEVFSSSNEKAFNIYDSLEINGCLLNIKFLNSSANFNNLNLSIKSEIKVIGKGVFEYTFHYIGGATQKALVYNSCFQNLDICGTYLFENQLNAFADYFNYKYSSSLLTSEIKKLVSHCGYAAMDNIITDNNNNFYIGDCESWQTKRQASESDRNLVKTLNFMMRSSPNVFRGTKRTLTINEASFNCETADFLLPINTYRAYKNIVNTRKDNYWWVNPRFLISTINFGGVNYYDTIYKNNYNNDPYFIGGFWIGAICTEYQDSSCFTSFGDPYKKLGVGSFPTISQIDSLSNLRWDSRLGSFVLSAFNRSSPSDSVILTFKNQCSPQCNSNVRYSEIEMDYSQFTKRSLGYEAKLKNTKLGIAYKTEVINPFLDMINGLAGDFRLTSSFQTNVRIYPKRFKSNSYYEKLYPLANGSFYSKSELNDSILIGQIGSESGASIQKFCKFGFKKIGTNRSWNFNYITVFKDFRIDPNAIVESTVNNQIEMANYQFLLKAGIVNNPGDTTWYDLKGWSSCWKFADITLISKNDLPLFDLPQIFVGNCNCYTCPETQKWSDSLYAEYPALYPSHYNYHTIATNFINRKLNTTLSFNEIQSQWESCDVQNKRFIKEPEVDFRIAIKKSDENGYTDSFLYRIMNNLETYFEVNLLETSDSLIYLCRFEGMPIDNIRLVEDSITKFFTSPQNGLYKIHKNYRNNYDLTLYSLSDSIVVTDCNKTAFDSWFSSIKASLFGGANMTNNSVSGIKFSKENFYEPVNHTSWMSQINIQALTHSQRKKFYDTLMNWNKKCNNVEIYFHYYTHDNSTPDSYNRTLCLKPKIGNSTPVCYSCDTFKNRLLDYQYDVVAKRKYPNAAMASDSIAQYLRQKLNKKLNVYTDLSNCLSCGNESMYICEETSQRLDSVISLFNKLAKNKKLNSSNFNFTSDYTILLNSIKTNNKPLNKPKYQLIGNKYGGFMIKIWYNTYDYDLINVQDLNLDTMKKFVKGISKFNFPSIVPTDGESSKFTLMSLDSLYKSRGYAFDMIGLKASKCCEMPNTFLCPQPYTREFLIEEEPCNELERRAAFDHAIVKYAEYLDSVKRKMKMDYEVFCFTGAKETFKLGLFQQRYHLTLYYYDQAGNLVKTVPPEGVRELNINNRKDSILSYRDNINATNQFVNTYHKLPTSYRYNSLNQLVWQKTPDGGVSKFWYDRLGRLMLSQNSVQISQSAGAQKVYSYTNYDALGRIVEVGQIVNNAVDSVALVQNINYYNTWLANSIERSQITKTFYDYPINANINEQFEEGQRNLRGRVSSIAYYDFYSADSNQYSRATHYSYDIHGNVDHLIQDFPELEEIEQRYKHLVYDYDLISGKVHAVAYQAGQPDQWFHRYQYDADNRLILAETSRDQVIWDKDAEYKYYKHGPLARTILGEHAVQGVDYAYTLHGWLKGVNSNTLQASRDIGKDGTGVLKNYTARDAYGFTLGYFTDNAGTGYFDGDYKSIGTTGFEANTASSPLANSSSNLYNGNISHMVTAVGVLMERNNNSPFATAYRYDQLNRIKSVHSYNGINISGNSWNSGTLQDAWKETFKYDANGNITRLKRYSALGIMDDLTYNYKSNTNQLTHVNETVGNGDYSKDIDDQSADNYQYDALGNLIKDDAEEINNIQWTVYGKIKQITRSSGSNRPDLEFNYDASGQRINKIVKRSPYFNDWKTTYYARDAQGNTMATYTKQYKISQDTSLYRLINNQVVADVGNEAFASFIDQQFIKNTQFAGALNVAVQNMGIYGNVVDQYTADSLFAYNSSLHQTVMLYYCNYANSLEQQQLNMDLWNNYKDSVFDQCNLDYMMFIENLLIYDASDELLNQLAIIDRLKVNQIYLMLGGSNPLPPLNVLINSIRSNSNTDVANMINAQFSPSEISLAMKGCSSTLFINTCDPISGSYSFCNILALLPNCGTGAVVNNWYPWLNFVKTYIDPNLKHTIIKNESDPSYLLSIIINKAGSLGIINTQKDAIALALSSINTLSLTDYLLKINKHMGAWVYQNVINAVGSNIVVKKEMVLDELHIYGSSRHGIHKPGVQLLVKSYQLNRLDSATDSTQAHLSYQYFKRTLTFKQYELTNHLGNVLATVLDRKTFVGDDTLEYYAADVYTAGLYYAFGSGIEEMQYSSDTGNRYRYGFNNQEQDPELGDCYAFEYRIHDARLGRFLSVDPLGFLIPYFTPYNSMGDNPNFYIDNDGRILEPWLIRRGFWFIKWKEGVNMSTEEALRFTSSYIEITSSLGMDGRLFRSVLTIIENSDVRVKLYSFHNYLQENYSNVISKELKKREKENSPGWYTRGINTINFNSTDRFDGFSNKAVIFEEFYHAAQYIYYGELGIEVSKLNREVEAKVAKAFAGLNVLDNDLFSYEVDFYKINKIYIDKINNNEKLTYDEQMALNSNIHDFAKQIASDKLYGLDINTFDISNMKLLSEQLGFDLTIPTYELPSIKIKK